jgi:hypothetical protein
MSIQRDYDKLTKRRTCCCDQNMMIQRQPLVVVVVHSTLLLAILRTITYPTFLTCLLTLYFNLPASTPPLLPIPLTEVISSIPLRIPLLV